MDPAIVSVTNLNDFHITKLDDGFEIGVFQIIVFQQPKKCSDGSLELQLQIKTVFGEKIKYNDKEIEDSPNGKIFSVVIPNVELENKIFYKEIEIKSDNPNYKFEKIELKIEPAVEISVDSRQVDFGKIWWDGHGLIAANSPSVKVSYTILKDAKCEVKSENNFRLKHHNKNEFIPYSMNGMTENGELFLLSSSNEFIANFKIEGMTVNHIPYAGDYRDKVIFSIKTDR